MKKFILLLAIAVSSCSTHSTAPTATPATPAHPFPKTFTQVSVIFQNLPANSSYQEQVWGEPSGDTTISNTSNGLISEELDFTFTDSSFSQSGDTIKAPGVTLVADQSTGILEYLGLTYVSDYDDPDGGQTYTYYSLACHEIPYVDSSNKALVALSGQAVETGLSSLGYNHFYNSGIALGGSSSSNSYTYKGTVSNAANLTIRFIP